MSNTITSADQSLLQTYLQGGGCLFLSGRGVVPELGGTSFFTSILHAGYPGGTGSPLLEGTDSLVAGLHFFVFGDNSVDVTEPDGLPGSARLLSFQGTTTGAAVKYDGDWKSCVLGFGFEDLVSGNPNFANPQQLLGPVLNWFGVDVNGIEGDKVQNIAAEFRLNQNYPNPFNPTTVASFELRVPSLVRLTVWDIAGRKVGTLLEGWMQAGVHRTEFDGSGLAAGIYILKLQAGEYMAARKMVLLK
jgi:hypothetical protein